MGKSAVRKGPVAERVAANVRELRKARTLSLADVSDRLAALGHPLIATAVNKIEQGERRVDVDDLVTLALLLDTTPNRLLLTGTADDERVALTPETEASSIATWRWACGEEPLGTPWPAPLSDPDNRGNAATDEALRQLQWHRDSRPHDPPIDFGKWPHERHLRHADEVEKLVDQMQLVLKLLGITGDDLLKYLRAFVPRPGAVGEANDEELGGQS